MRLQSDLDQQLNRFYSVAQTSKIAESLNFHWLRRFRDFDNKELVFVLLHSCMNVCEVNEVIFGDQRLFVAIAVVNGNRPSCAHRNFPKITRCVIAASN